MPTKNGVFFTAGNWEKRHLFRWALQTNFVPSYFFRALVSPITGKSLSESLILASTNPQYEDRLLFELQIQFMKIPSWNLGRTCCVQKLFLTLRTIFCTQHVLPMFCKKKSFWQRFTCTRQFSVQVHISYIQSYLDYIKAY